MWYVETHPLILDSLTVDRLFYQYDRSSYHHRLQSKFLFYSKQEVPHNLDLYHMVAIIWCPLECKILLFVLSNEDNNVSIYPLFIFLSISSLSQSSCLSFLFINASIHPSNHSFIHLSIYLPSIQSFICPSIHPYVHPSIHPSIHLYVHPSVHAFIHLSAHLSICPFIYWSIHQSILIHSLP